MEGDGAVRLASEGRREECVRRRRKVHDDDRDSHPFWHDLRRVRPDRPRLDRHREASRDRSPLHGNDLSADAGIDRVSPRERLQDLHRLCRGRRFHAPLDGEGLRDSPENVVGSSGKITFEFRDGKPVLLRPPEIDFIDDGPSKPIAIRRHIGRHPIAVFGNSDGDLQMLQWTMSGSGARFALLVHHTDAEREWAYDRDSPLGKLDKALDEAHAQGWTVVDMKSDWKTIFPFGNK
jgi:hypothetical protein